MGRILGILWSIRLIPHILVFYFSKNRELLEYERDRWLATHRLSKRGLRGFLLLVNSLPEYRSLFYFRTGAKWLSVIAKPQNNLEFYVDSEKIGKGLVIWHGFSTVINVESMGNDCEIWQNVTIGKSNSYGPDPCRPHIGNRCKISSHAVVVGNIILADDVVIGGGAVAVKDVLTPGSIVVSQPSRIIGR